jgi:hypothetical protein
MSDPKVTTCYPSDPYFQLPDMNPDGEVLGWYSISDPIGEYEDQSVLLSDACLGDPPVEEVIKVVSHEYLHYILDEEVGEIACKYLDRLVDEGDFIVDRAENHVEDDRPLQPALIHRVEDELLDDGQ